jgi:hypothetical protein
LSAVWLFWVACSNASLARPLAQRLGHQQHLQVGRHAEHHAQAQLVALDVASLRPAPLEPPRRVFERPSMAKPSPSFSRL